MSVPHHPLSIVDAAASHDLEARLEKSELLISLIESMGQRGSLRTLCEAVCAGVTAGMPVACCAIALQDHEAGQLLLCAASGAGPLASDDGLVRQGVRVALDLPRISLALAGQPVFIGDLALPDSGASQRWREDAPQSLLMVPLIIPAGPVLGVLATLRQEQHQFGANDANFLARLAEFVAKAVHLQHLRGGSHGVDEALGARPEDSHSEAKVFLRTMVSGVMHGLTNALSPVTLYADSLLAQEPQLGAQSRRYLENIKSAIDDVSTTLSRMRRIERNWRQSALRAELVVNGLVEQIAEQARLDFAGSAARANCPLAVDFALALEPDIPLMEAVESDVRAALANLAANAVDALPRGGRVVFTTRHRPELRAIEIEVSDNGVGMDEATHRRCLEPFFTTRAETRAGLGLSMVYGIMQRHGGDLEIETAPDVGTRARLRFPLRPAQAAPVATRVPAESHALPGRLRLLVVDDEPPLLRSLEDVLSADGHAVETAADGEAGIALFSSALDAGNPFDIVITDLGMPQVDGLQVALAVKTRSPGTRVVMLTGWGRQMLEGGARPPAVDVLLSKPPRMAELRRALSPSA